MNPRGLSSIAVLIALLSIPVNGFAKIGDTPEQLKEKLGDPVAASVDHEGCGLRIYRTADFDEIRVTFVGDKSRMENYRPKETGVDPETAFAGLRAEYHGDLQDPIRFDPETGEGSWEILPDKISNQERSDPWTGQKGLVIGEDEKNELKFVNRSKKIQVYSGLVERREVDREQWIIIRAREGVIELPLAGSQPKLDALRSGAACSITLRDEVPHNLDMPIAWVGRRVHLDASDAIEDAHDSFQLVLRVEVDGKVLFDRSICEMHKVPMVLREVPVRSDIVGLLKDERNCEEHAPHSREFVFGDFSDGETAEAYICQACQTSFNECKATHPEADEGPGEDAVEITLSFDDS